MGEQDGATFLLILPLLASKLVHWKKRETGTVSKWFSCLVFQLLFLFCKQIKLLVNFKLKYKLKRIEFQSL